MPATYTPWRIDADAEHGMNFETYRQNLIHETNAIANFFDHSSDGFIVSAPKGYGKTLLLTAKKKQIEENGGIRLGPTGGHEMLDRPAGNIPEQTEESLESLGTDFDFWRNAWYLAIAVSAIKVEAQAPHSTFNLEAIECHKWIRARLKDSSFHMSVCQIFTSLIELDHSQRMHVVQNANKLTFLVQAIRSPIAFFIDNVDEYFKPLLSHDHKQPQTVYGVGYHRRSNAIWTAAQLGLAATSYSMRNSNSHIKVYCTIRREALLQLSEYPVEHAQILGKTVQIEYREPDFLEIFKKNVKLMRSQDLCEPDKIDPIIRFFGEGGSIMRHRFVKASEPAFNFLLRHTLGRPRDLMILGKKLSGESPQQRDIDTVKERVNEATVEIVDDLIANMAPFVTIPVLGKLLELIETNVIAESCLEAITAEYLMLLENAGETIVEHQGRGSLPFHELQRIGLIGWIELNSSVITNHTLVQRFRAPHEISFKRDLDMMRTEGYYLVHPALDYKISTCRGPKYWKDFHRHNIVGNRCVWREPGSSMLVIKGDACGFSRVMESEFYPEIAKLMYEWSKTACRDIRYYDVLGGDSIMMIDGSFNALCGAMETLSKLAEEHEKLKLKFRFGGSAGPIQFVSLPDSAGRERISPLGQSLRTAARLEPYAPEGALLIDQSYYEQVKNDIDDWRLRLMNPDEITAQYDATSKQFNLSKSKKDPDIRTALYVVSVDKSQK